MASILEDAHNTTRRKVTRSGQQCALGHVGWEVTHAQLGNAAVDEQLTSAGPHPLASVHSQQRRNQAGSGHPASANNPLSDLPAQHVAAEHEAAGLTGSG